jgi:Zn-dependent protease
MQVDALDRPSRERGRPVREPRPASAKASIVHDQPNLTSGSNLFPAGTPSAAPYEGEYLPPGSGPPPHKESSGWKKGVGPAVIGAGVLFAKFKSLLFLLLSFKWVLIGSKVLLSSFSFVASIWFYSLFFGWPFAFVFVLLILVHELGHAAFMRIFGVPASMPYFIPGFGALIQMKGRPASALQESYIALAGPLMGTVGALACFTYGEATMSKFWMAAAYTGFFLNLFNLIPVVPLDGGRVIGSVSPRVWIFGLIGLIVAAVAFHWFNPLLIVIVLLSIPKAIAAWRGDIDPAYYALTPLQRGGVAAAYFTLVGFLIVAMLESRVTI